MFLSSSGKAEAVGFVVGEPTSYNPVSKLKSIQITLFTLDKASCSAVSRAQDDVAAASAIRPNANHVACLARIFRCDRMFPSDSIRAQ